MKVELIDGKLVLSPTTADEGRVIFALAAAWTAFESVLYPVIGEPLRYREGCKTESNSSQLDPDYEHPLDKPRCI